MSELADLIDKLKTLRHRDYGRWLFDNVDHEVQKKAVAEGKMKLSPLELRKDYEDVAMVEYHRRVPTYTDLCERRKQRVEELENEIKSLNATPQITEDEIEVMEVRTGCYSPYGDKAWHYAKTRAELKAFQLEKAGIPCRVEEMEGSYDQHGIWNGSYKVFAKTNEIGLELVRLNPATDLLEEVRFCWDNDVNPRNFADYIKLPMYFEREYLIPCPCPALYPGEDINCEDDEDSE